MVITFHKVGCEETIAQTLKGWACGGWREETDSERSWQGLPFSQQSSGHSAGTEAQGGCVLEEEQIYCQALTACLACSLCLGVFHLLDAQLTETLYNVSYFLIKLHSKRDFSII